MVSSPPFMPLECNERPVEAVLPYFFDFRWYAIALTRIGVCMNSRRLETRPIANRLCINAQQ